MPGPEAIAREAIDAALAAAGWAVQNFTELNLHAARGVAAREFPLAPGFGFADYLLYVDGQAVGVIEAKKAGTTLSGVEPQSAQYSEGLPANLPAAVRPLPFLYQSTGDETWFTNGLDPEPRSRRVFWFHKPETLAAWLAAEPVFLPSIAGKPDPLSQRPASLRLLLQTFPSLERRGLRDAQFLAIANLERSLRENRPRALIQMATGSGKTIATISAIYRLIKYGDAKRVLFLVDRDNLGKQAYRELQAWVTPDDGRKFTELYNVQRLASNKLDPVARVVITTIQRLYSMLKSEELPPEAEEGSLFDSLASLRKESAPVVYNPALPIETFDFVFIDECHRSIYTVWRQVLEYFDAFLVGLTATPSKQTFGFFQQNLVMEYQHAQAVADRVNVDYDVLSPIRGACTTSSSTTSFRNRSSRSGDRPSRAETWSESNPTGRWRAYGYEQLVARDKCSLDIFWLRDESLEASENLPEPDVLASEIAESLRAALAQFEEVAADLGE